MENMEKSCMPLADQEDKWSFHVIPVDIGLNNLTNCFYGCNKNSRLFDKRRKEKTVRSLALMMSQCMHSAYTNKKCNDIIIKGSSCKLK